jgi:RimJ/RimL family protein N-acetyltransferase
MSDREPIRIPLEGFKDDDFELRQIHDEEDVLSFTREMQTNAGLIEKYHEIHVDDYVGLEQAHLAPVSDLSQDEELHFGIFFKDKLFQGGISAIPLPDDDQIGIEFWLDQYATGSGVATASIAALAKYLREEGLLNDMNLTAYVHPKNKSAIKALGRAGFIENDFDEESDAKIGYIPAISIDEDDDYTVSESELVEGSDDLLDIALSIGEGTQATFADDRKFAKVDIKKDDEGCIKISISEYFYPAEKGTRKEKGLRKLFGDGSKRRYILNSLCTIDPESAEITKFDVDIKVLDKNTGQPVKATLEPETIEPTNPDSTSSHTLGNRSKRRPRNRIIVETGAKKMQRQVKPQMTRDHLMYFLKTLNSLSDY